MLGIVAPLWGFWRPRLILPNDANFWRGHARKNPAQRRVPWDSAAQTTAAASQVWTRDHGPPQGHGSPGDLDADAERHVLRGCECGAQLSCPFENASNWRKGGMPTLTHRHSKGVSYFRAKSLTANLPWIYPMKWVHGYSEWVSFFLSCFTKTLLFSDFRAFEKIRESFDVFSFKVNGRCLATLIFHLKGA